MKWDNNDDEEMIEEYTINLYMDAAQPQVPPTIVTLPLECPMKLGNPPERGLSALGVNIKLAHPTKGSPTCRMSPGQSVPVLT
jgi:hypothetical protein